MYFEVLSKYLIVITSRPYSYRGIRKYHYYMALLAIYIDKVSTVNLGYILDNFNRYPYYELCNSSHKNCFNIIAFIGYSIRYEKKG